MRVNGHTEENVTVSRNVSSLRSQMYSHQLEFIENCDRNVLLTSSTCSGKTDAFLSAASTLLAQSTNNRYVSLYLVPTRILANGQFERFAEWSEEMGIDCVVLHRGLRSNILSHKLGNHLVISSPDILFYMLLRRSRGWQSAFEMFLEKNLAAVCFDELHLYDDYTLYNINNLIYAINTGYPGVPIWLLTATSDLGVDFDTTPFKKVTGVGTTWAVQVTGVDIDSRDVDVLARWMINNNYVKRTVIVLNSAQRAKRLRRRFPDAAWLVGRIHYDPADGDPEQQINTELQKCREGRLTIATSVFRQGVDLEFDRLITEEPLNANDAVQTFGRCGRRNNHCEFMVITGRSPVKAWLNSEKTVSRSEFESGFSAFFRLQERKEITDMAKACWYKLYHQTKMKPFLEPGISEEMEQAFNKYNEYLPDVSFRDPLPALDADGDQIGLFDVLRYDGASRYIRAKQSRPSSATNTIGVFSGRSRLADGRFRFARRNERPEFNLIKRCKIPDLELEHLVLQLGNMNVSVNARVGASSEFEWRCRQKSFRSGCGKILSFQPCQLGY